MGAYIYTVAESPRGFVPQKEGIMTVKKAIIPCAGLGTRFLPVTKVVPKELLPIVDTPALTYILEEAERSGIEEVLIVLSPRKQYIRKLFEADDTLNAQLKSKGDDEAYALANRKFGLNISFSTQRVMNGNGRAIALGRRFAKGEPVAVLFGDDVMFTGEGMPVTAQLIKAYEQTGATIVGCQRSPEDVARKCGVMLEGAAVSDRITEVRGIVEKPEGELPGRLVSLGRFIVTPDIYDVVDRTSERQGEVYLTDAISELAKSGGKVCAYEFEARRYDIGDKEGYLEATVEFALRDDRYRDKFKAYLNTLK